jgi:hypothetical protein
MSSLNRPVLEPRIPDTPWIGGVYAIIKSDRAKKLLSAKGLDIKSAHLITFHEREGGCGVDAISHL